MRNGIDWDSFAITSSMLSAASSYMTEIVDSVNKGFFSPGRDLEALLQEIEVNLTSVANSACNQGNWEKLKGLILKDTKSIEAKREKKQDPTLLISNAEPDALPAQKFFLIKVFLSYSCSLLCWEPLVLEHILRLALDGSDRSLRSFPRDSYVRPANPAHHRDRWLYLVLSVRFPRLVQSIAKDFLTFWSSF